VKDLRGETRLKDLPDIRKCSAYRQYIKKIGGTIDFKQNGYRDLSKEQRRELKFLAGNMMQCQLRQIVDKSVSSLRNFFMGFLTLKDLKKQLSGQ
jgi:hypothetical protein